MRVYCPHFLFLELQLDKESLLARIKELQFQLEESATRHNGLIGRLMEAQELLAALDKKEAVEA